MMDKKNTDTKLTALRAEMAKCGVKALLLPRGDAFCGEEVPAADERLAFISGFAGSAGMAVITMTEAALFSDGRYTLQMEAQTNAEWQCFTLPDASIIDWISEHISDGDIGFDPWLLPVATVRKYRKELEPMCLRPLDYNPVDVIWEQRPPPPSGVGIDLAPEYRGAGRKEKIKQTIDSIKRHFDTKKSDSGTSDSGTSDSGAGQVNIGAMVISTPAELAWLLNIRGDDLPYTPVLLAFGILSMQGEVTVFTDAARLAHCDKAFVNVADFSDLPSVLAGFAPSEVLVDSECPWAIADMLGARSIEAESIIDTLKSCKVDAEIKASTVAHRGDGVAMVQFLHWLDETLHTRPIRETDAAEQLLAFRADVPDFICPSFPTICGGGSNAAIIHYRAIAGKDKEIPRDSVCLIDSGGQYQGATTDITRTIATGAVTDKIATAFTNVLKAHIALASCRFPVGTTGVQLDAITRAPLWRAGMDFEHGTGHGVGAGLSVHEGVGISKRSTQPILEGMILSNEPGYYVADDFGIRIENLMLIKRDSSDGMLFSTPLTLVPIDKRLIMQDALSVEEIAWLNAYHQRVRDEITPLIKKSDTAVINWLLEATAPI